MSNITNDCDQNSEQCTTMKTKRFDRLFEEEKMKTKKRNNNGESCQVSPIGLIICIFQNKPKILNHFLPPPSSVWFFFYNLFSFTMIFHSQLKALTWAGTKILSANKKNFRLSALFWGGERERDTVTMRFGFCPSTQKMIWSLF